jgi:hypothetical protein
MSKVIRIDDEVWRALQKEATPLQDTPNSALRRLLLEQKRPLALTFRQKQILTFALDFLNANRDELADDGMFEEWSEPTSEQEIDELLQQLQ